MPTARELLEQADALMRRNRSAVMDDIPVLTDSVPSYPGARMMRSRVPPPRVPPPVAKDPIPTLTERVVPGTPPAKGVVVEEGEPSDWLQLGAVEPSIIGEAPDSIAIVPAVPPPPVERPPRPAEPEVIEFTAPEEAEAAFDRELAPRAVPVAPTPAPPKEPPPSAAKLAAAFEHVEPTMPEFTFIEDETIIEEGDTEADLAPPLEADERAAESSGWSDVESGAVEAAAVETSGEAAAEPSPPARTPESIEDAMLGAPLEMAASLAASAAAENARWSAMAEEIRMQVLQRIDLFTDTGLREQLGARLQPIVDRASADLVATINLHVGELLRAYVAEAIEREIESWRRNN